MKKIKIKSVNRIISEGNFSHKLYILMRSDLPSLNAGKAMAQACHGSNQFIHEFGSLRHVQLWQKEGEGFGTTIVLAVNQSKLIEVIANAHSYGVPAGTVIDTTYPFIVPNPEIAELISSDELTGRSIYKDNGQVVMFRKECTCAYLFIRDGSEDQRMLVGELPLHP